ncbi:WxL domain-containing protein [Erysipelothrix sp. D19-032]
MKKKIIKPLAVMMATSMLLAGTMSIFAEEGNAPKSETSKASVSFTIDNEPTDPVNPIDPTDPTDPEILKMGMEKVH